MNPIDLERLDGDVEGADSKQTVMDRIMAIIKVNNVSYVREYLQVSR